ncbi:MAG: SDR family oxidoreductase [Erysipelothrix sp.]
MKLNGKTILVTGVSRSNGIGATVALKLRDQGARVIVHGYSSFDSDVRYSDSDALFTSQFCEVHENLFAAPSSDLSSGRNCESLIEFINEKYGVIHGLVLNHAYSTQGALGQLTEDDINKHLSTNVTGNLLLIQKFSEQLTDGSRGAITLFTSGQYLGPMTQEIAYAVSKDAIIGIAKQASYALASKNIQVNVINPGPTDTGYASGNDYEQIRNMFPAKRWGVPEDAANLVTFLQSDESIWITGQIIASEGGFTR